MIILIWIGLSICLMPFFIHWTQDAIEANKHPVIKAAEDILKGDKDA